MDESPKISQPKTRPPPPTSPVVVDDSDEERLEPDDNVRHDYDGEEDEGQATIVGRHYVVRRGAERLICVRCGAV